MKKTFHALTLSALFLMVAFSSHAAEKNYEDIRKHKSCKLCGMNRETYSYSRVLLVYNNDTSTGTCSLRCAALDLALKMGRRADSIMVADFNSRKLIDAEKAYYVIGGSRQGTMSTRGKWAFTGKDQARRFMAKNGGAPGTFHDALKASFEDLYSDLKLFMEESAKLPKD
jgi:copper chaperone NosL